MSKIAFRREQSISQLAIAWLLSRKGLSSVLVGVSRVSQLLENLSFTDVEIQDITSVIE